MRRKRPAGAFAHVVGRLPGARRPTPWRPLLALLATFQASGVPGCARRQLARRSSWPEIGADRREHRRPGANGCARRARLPTIHASRLRRLPTIQILQIIHGATYVCARRSSVRRSRLRTSAAGAPVELSGDWRGSARTSPPWGERLRTVRTVADDTRLTAAEIADNSDTSNNSRCYLCMCPAAHVGSVPGGRAVRRSSQIGGMSPPWGERLRLVTAQ